MKHAASMLTLLAAMTEPPSRARLVLSPFEIGITVPGRTTRIKTPASAARKRNRRRRGWR